MSSIPSVNPLAVVNRTGPLPALPQSPPPQTAQQPALPGPAPPTDCNQTQAPRQHPAACNQLDFPTVAQAPVPAPPSSRPEAQRLASLYLSDNPEAIVHRGSGVLAPERNLPTEGVSRISLYHNFATPDHKQAYVTVSSPQGGSFYVRGQGADVGNAFNAARQANENYARHKQPDLNIKIRQADGTFLKTDPLTFNETTRRYEPEIQLTPGAQVFIPVGPQLDPVAISNPQDFERHLHSQPDNTLVANLDLEPLNDTQLSAGTYVKGAERGSGNSQAGSLLENDFARAQRLSQDTRLAQQALTGQRIQDQALGDYVQSPITGRGNNVGYGHYQGDPVGALSTTIQPHHNSFVTLGNDGVIVYPPQDIGQDQSSGLPFVRLIGLGHNDHADVDDDLVPDEQGEQVFAPPGPQSTARLLGTANYEATNGYLSRTRPLGREDGNEGDKEGYGLPYQLPNEFFRDATGAAPPDGQILDQGRLIIRGGSNKTAYSIIDANGQTLNGTLGMMNQTGNFTTLDLNGLNLVLPLRVITQAASDLGLQIAYDRQNLLNLTHGGGKVDKTGNMAAFLSPPPPTAQPPGSGP